MRGAHKEALLTVESCNRQKDTAAMVIDRGAGRATVLAVHRGVTAILLFGRYDAKTLRMYSRFGFEAGAYVSEVADQAGVAHALADIDDMLDGYVNAARMARTADAVVSGRLDALVQLKRR